MKKIVTLLLVAAMLLTCACPVFADSRVIYDGDARDFIFTPGSEYSPTDLFSNFKDVLPGDVLTQPITVRNDASKEVKVKIYMRSLGADEQSVDFLSQLNLSVRKSEENDMGYMFDAAANESAQLTDWVCLGTLYSGGEVNLDVVLSVPAEMGNEYYDRIGYLTWEFMVEEFPVEPGDPDSPPTGDDANLVLWTAVICGSVVFLFVIFLVYKRKKEEEGETAR